MRIAAIGDLHVRETDTHPFRELFAEVSQRARILVLAGDLTDFGKTREAEILCEDLQACSIPVVAVLGNHDYECGQPEVIIQHLRGAGVTVLDGDAYEVEGVGFAGVMGCPGGFGRFMLSSFGEPAIKTFVHAQAEEALKLENAMRMVRGRRTFVVLHYSPIPETLAGEPAEIMPFLGSSRMAEVIDRFEDVAAVVHGHAHRGAHFGRTLRGAPVWNVARFVAHADHGCPYTLIDV
jgi:Icc-related predicted phosphoesterase